MVFASWQRYCTVLQQWTSAKLCGVEQRAPPIFGRAAITLGIGPHSGLLFVFSLLVSCGVNCGRTAGQIEMPLGKNVRTLQFSLWKFRGSKWSYLVNFRCTGQSGPLCLTSLMDDPALAGLGYPFPPEPCFQNYLFNVTGGYLKPNHSLTLH